MNDQTEDGPAIVPGQVAILDPKGKAVNREKPGKRARPPGDYMKSSPPREEVATYLAKASLTMGQKVYDQLSTENQEQLERLEHIVTQRVIQYIESRTLRGRLRRAWRSLFPRRLELVGTKAVAPRGAEPLVDPAAQPLGDLEDEVFAVVEGAEQPERPPE